MTFIATLSAVAADNWQICVAHSLWGVGSSAKAQKAARAVKRGDTIYVWQSGAGLLARAVALAPAKPAVTADVPWPQPERYTYTIEIRVDQQLEEPVPDSFPANVSTRFGIRSHVLQTGFYFVDDEVARAMDTVFAGRPATPAPNVTVAVPVEPSRPVVAGVYLEASSSVPEVLLALYRRTIDSDGEVLVVGPESARRAVAEELTRPPFPEIADRVRFVTPEQLRAELTRSLGARDGRTNP